MYIGFDEIAAFSFMLLLINSLCYGVIFIIFSIKRYYYKQNFLYIATLILFSILVGIAIMVFSGWLLRSLIFYNFYKISMIIFSTLIPIIIAYWIYLTSKNKTRDYIIFGIIFAPLTAFFVYMIYMIYFW